MIKNAIISLIITFKKLFYKETQKKKLSYKLYYLNIFLFKFERHSLKKKKNVNDIPNDKKKIPFS
jgi:hypothetical protein